MANDLPTAVDALIARANRDDDLRARLIADPAATISAETCMTVPDDWNIVASQAADGSLSLGFVNDELPLDYLELVSGGDPIAGCTGGADRMMYPTGP